MACYHFSLKDPISRSKGHSVIQKAAYNARTQYFNEREGVKTPDFSGKGPLLDSYIMLDQKIDVPDWVYDPEKMLNRALAAEKRKDAQEGQEIVLAFIHELGMKRNKWMLNDFLREQFIRGTGRVAFVNIHPAHENGDDRNDHAHVLLMPREITDKGWGKKLPPILPHDLERLRDRWAEMGAHELRKLGHDIEAERYRWGHLDIKKQFQKAQELGDLEWAKSLDREPTKHEGPHVRAMDKERGIETDIGKKNKEAKHERDLSKTAAEIRLAYNLTNTGQEFINAMEDRGFFPAIVSEKDAERLNRWERQRIKDQWEAPAPRDEWMAQKGKELNQTQHDAAQRSYDKWVAEREPSKKPMSFEKYVAFVQDRNDEERNENYERYKKGEIVILDQWSGVHQLNYRNTGASFKERTERLKDVDRSGMMTVSAADNAASRYQQHRSQERKEAWKQKQKERQDEINERYNPTNPRNSGFRSKRMFAEAAHEAGNDLRPENLKGAAGQVWRAYRESGHEDTFTSPPDHTKVGRTGDRKAFAEVLDRMGISFGRATKEEAARSHKDAAFARSVGNYAPRFMEGETVIVREPLAEFRGRDGEVIKPRRVYKLDHSLADKFTSTLGGKLQSIAVTLEASDRRYAERKESWAKDRLDYATSKAPGRSSLRRGMKMARKVGRVLGGVGAGAGSLLHGGADAFGSLISPPNTPKRQRETDRAEARREQDDAVQQERNNRERERGFDRDR